MTRSCGALGPAVAGTWYPADRERLRAQVDALVAKPGATILRPTVTREISALIAPHAGFVYSGGVAGAGFRLLRDRSYRRVVLIGPSHHVAFPGGAVPAAGCYRTPLGDVPIDIDAAERVGARSGMRVVDAPFEPEHSLEAEIPFLQRTLAGDWLLLPVLIGGGSSAEDVRLVADALEPVTGEGTLWVVSSDFTHFGPRFGYVPFDQDVPERIQKLDMGAVDPIVAGDGAAFSEYVRRTGATICGRAAIEVVLHRLPGATSELVAYDTSGYITGDWEHSVSYASLVFGSPARDG